MNEKTIQTLSQYQEFADFLRFVIQEREACIAAMFKAPKDDIVQISGQILAYDQIIQATDAHSVVRRHERLGA